MFQGRFRGVARVGVVALAACLVLAVACGDDDEDDGDSAPPATVTQTAGESPTATQADAAGGETIEVTAVDYEFEGLPSTVEAGTRIEMVNESDDEAHELVAVRIPDSETRPVSELLELPEEELFAAVPGDPALVLIAGPGEEAMAVVGDGALTEPGRYAIVCLIPVGADPEAILSEDSDGPPEGDGPPHASQGMFAELTVE